MPPTILGLGEVLWDIFEDGKALGGAPCNFAYHANCLGYEGVPLSRVGQEELGREILERLRGLSVRTDLIQRDPHHPTGQVHVRLGKEGSPEFTIMEGVAWDHMVPQPEWLEEARRAAAICFGTLAQRSPQSRATVRKVLRAGKEAVRVLDVNFRQRYYSRAVLTRSLEFARVLKLNAAEVQELRRLLNAGGAEEQFLRALMDQYGLELICVTRGAQGCTLYDRARTLRGPVPSVRVVDTVGAGDAFTAGLVIKFLEGRPLEAIAEGATLLGGFVAARRGATPAIPAELAERFRAL